MDIAENGCQHVVEVVGYTAGQHADRLDPLCTMDMVAGLAPLGLILAHPDEMRDMSQVIT